MLEELQSSADAKLLNVDTEKVEITADHLLQPLWIREVSSKKWLRPSERVKA